MSLKDQPAFPEIKSKSDDPDNFNVTDVFSEGGMTLRQHAAIEAMKGLLSNSVVMAAFTTITKDPTEGLLGVAGMAIKAGDILIAELEKAKP